MACPAFETTQAKLCRPVLPLLLGLACSSEGALPPVASICVPVIPRPLPPPRAAGPQEGHPARHGQHLWLHCQGHRPARCAGHAAQQPQGGSGGWFVCTQKATPAAEKQGRLHRLAAHKCQAASGPSAPAPRVNRGLPVHAHPPASKFCRCKSARTACARPWPSPLWRRRVRPSPCCPRS